MDFNISSNPNIQNRLREIEVLNALVVYVSNRDDDDDPDLIRAEDVGFLKDLATILSRSLQQGYDPVANDLSDYLQEQELGFDFQENKNETPDYTNDMRLRNLRVFMEEELSQLAADVEDIKKSK